MKTWVVDCGGKRHAVVLAENEDLVWAWAQGKGLPANRVWEAESLGAKVTILLELLAPDDAPPIGRPVGAKRWPR